MPYATINDSNAWTGSGMYSQPNFSGSIWIPSTRAGHTGERPIRITSLHAFVSGYVTSSAIGYCYIGGQWIGDAELSYQNANGSIAHTTWFSGGGYLSSESGYWGSLGMNSNGRMIHMGYRVYPGLNITNVTGYVWPNRSFTGGFNYVEVPSSPRSPSIYGITSTGITVGFAGPESDGGSPVTGYIVQIANNSSFSNPSNYSSTGQTRITGLLPGRKYWVRVLATNEFYTRYGIGSPWSSVVSATTAINPPVWTDKYLSSTMRAESLYSDGVSASTTTGFPVTYSVTSGKLPAGVSLNSQTGAVIADNIPSSAVINGPTYKFSITASNAGGKITEEFTKTVLPESSLWEDNVIDTEMRVARQYSDSVKASGTGVEYSVGPLGSSPPSAYLVVPGVSLNRLTGEISGTPTKPGSYSVNIFATNDSGGSTQQNFLVTVRPTGRRYLSETASEYIKSIRRWNGEQWVDISIVRKWDGTKWADLEMQ